MTITKAVLKAAALACALAIAGVALYSHDAIAQAARSAISKSWHRNRNGRAGGDDYLNTALPSAT